MRSLAPHAEGRPGVRHRCTQTRLQDSERWLPTSDPGKLFIDSRMPVHGTLEGIGTSWSIARVRTS